MMDSGWDEEIQFPVNFSSLFQLHDKNTENGHYTKKGVNCLTFVFAQFTI